MRRNPAARQYHELKALTRRLGMTPETQAQPGGSSLGTVGGNLPGTGPESDGGAGEWAPYGLVGFTPVGMPFRATR